MPAPELQQYDWPFRLAPDGTIATVPQGSDQEIGVCMATIILWPLGTRDNDIEFGTPDQAFIDGGPDLDLIRTALATGEPRAVTRIIQDDTALASFVARVRAGFDQGSG